MRAEKATQILLLSAGLVLFLGGIFRGEAAVVLSKAIKKLCMECVGIG
ncbi:CD1871A family CXXC motif-containing protein [Clostridium celatum]